MAWGPGAGILRDLGFDGAQSFQLLMQIQAKKNPAKPGVAPGSAQACTWHLSQGQRAAATKTMNPYFLPYLVHFFCLVVPLK